MTRRRVTPVVNNEPRPYERGMYWVLLQEQPQERVNPKYPKEPTVLGHFVTREGLRGWLQGLGVDPETVKWPT